jgi:long-chain acyl-CoA synthetase
MDVDNDDPAVIQYTAGATGVPKGAELTCGNILSNANACQEIMRITNRDLLLAAIPFFHPIGQTLIMNLGLLSGSSLHLVPRIDSKELVEHLRKGSCSVFVGVPSLFKLALENSSESDEQPERPVRLCVCGGGVLHEDILKEFERRFGTYILETYTLSETSPVISFNQWRSGRRVGSLGHPIPGVEMKVVDERGDEVSIGEVGEIIVKGANVMRRYINRPRLSAEALKDGWFHTGDLGKMDINGFFYLIDRLDGRIVKGGFSIYPTEVESLLLCHPDVEDVAVVGVPDATLGEEVKACIVLKKGAKTTTEQFADYCREHMAIYKIPTIIRFYKDLPRTSTGRIIRKDLQA